MTLLRGIHASLLASVITASTHAADPDKKEIGFGATGGPYADQIRYCIKPLLEKDGCKVAIVEFTDKFSRISRLRTVHSTPTRSSTRST